MANLQTQAFIQTMENLFHDVRDSETEEEDLFLSIFNEMRELLEYTFNYPNIVLAWNLDEEETSEETTTRRKKVMKHLDVAFHNLYRKLIEAFKPIRHVFRQIAPGISDVYVYALPSVEKLVELYIEKSVVLKTALYKDYFPEKGNNDKIWSTA